MSEKYVPTQEEINETGKRMNETEKDLSFVRERQANDLESLGVSGYLYLIKDPKGEFVEGKLNGHDVQIRKPGTGPSFIEGLQLTYNQQEEFSKKYLNLAIDANEEKESIEYAKLLRDKTDKEIRLEKILKELI